jgi:hypothetical protein
MAKTLQRTMPTSSVANLLDPSVSAQVVARQDRYTPASLPRVTPEFAASFESTAFPRLAEPSQSPVQPTGEVPDIARQFTLTRSTDRTLKRIVEVFADATGLELRHSELLRAILYAAALALPALIEEASKIGPLRRPKNERGREAQREAVERRIAFAFAAALRSTTTQG